MTTIRSGRRRLMHHICWALPTALLVAAACSNNSEVADGDDAGSGTGSTGSGSTGQAGADGTGGKGTGGLINLGGGFGEGGTGTGTGGTGPVCETAQSEAELQPIYLGFAFDVSGSMGQLDRPNWWHDPTKKWTPVTTAAKEFFADDTSVNIYSSLVLFPTKSNKCDESSYGTPVVDMTALPSSAFGGALDDYALVGKADSEVGNPLEGGDWRGNTPTLQAVNATIAYLQGVLTKHPDAKVALVLVTDGVPSGCTGGIPEVSAAVAEVKDTIPTYVIGVMNPTTAPDTLPAGWPNWQNDDTKTPDDETQIPGTPPNALADLDAIALAGGTEAAVLIDTNDPSATKKKFRDTIDAIRAKSVSCSLEIPPNPDGGTFEKEKIEVVYTSGTTKTHLSYDPTCKKANAWHYDDANDPQSIELCKSTCTTVQEDPKAAINVNFLCEPNPEIVK